jgi:hypothetical protein
MKTSKIVVASILSVLLVGSSFISSFATDNPKKDSLKKEEKKQETKATYSQEEVKFIAEMDSYYAKKYSNPLNVVQSKVEKVIVVNLAGNVVQELSVTDHQEHESKLPAGAEKLMVKGNTAYYIVLQ